MSEWTKDQENVHIIPADLTHVDFYIKGVVQSNLKECCTKLSVGYLNDNKKQIELKTAPKYFKDK